MKRIRDGMARKLAPTHEAVDFFCRELDRHLLRGLPAPERFAIGLLVREALTNAVVHGAAHTTYQRAVQSGSASENAAARECFAEVECEVAPIAGGVVIRVADRGTGFDWRRWLRERPQPQIESGRGLHLLHLYANEVRFLGRGNAVELTRIFSQGDRHEI